MAVCRQRRWKKDWVIDLDVARFFDSVPWDLMVRAVACRSESSSLTAPWSSETGELRRVQRLTRAGQPVMHYAFDAWMVREFPNIPFVRYCDDAVVHRGSERQVRQVRDAIAARLAQVGLELHPDKTRIVYCQDADRRGGHEVTSFTFLGYTFRPRLAKNKWGSTS